MTAKVDDPKAKRVHGSNARTRGRILFPREGRITYRTNSSRRTYSNSSRIIKSFLDS